MLGTETLFTVGRLLQALVASRVLLTARLALGLVQKLGTSVQVVQFLQVPQVRGPAQEWVQRRPAPVRVWLQTLVRARGWALVITTAWGLGQVLVLVRGWVLELQGLQGRLDSIRKQLEHLPFNGPLPKTIHETHIGYNLLAVITYSCKIYDKFVL
jgi:hypothetical protein